MRVHSKSRITEANNLTADPAWTLIDDCCAMPTIMRVMRLIACRQERTEMTDAVKSSAGSNQPNTFLEISSVIDLHPLYAAINRAREVAEAKDCEPASVAWDPA
jgi:hypothetical protein